ncbi:CPBP family intramembrane metalloprotease [Clostridium sp. YIM B02505]|uniref:CPBP family intramembrane metalloprotease n=1 Tax=Clostridium yunnanense TaxID=2800325 RepID=A0ABS1EV55_9CLOT|nr:CPBP family intramembrane glutamic endopeptidase [Clostridium yunnanense]MBK1813220.1 CPBP family intramembrane metalloprotease [Clostridium yunnanense]
MLKKDNNVKVRSIRSNIFRVSFDEEVKDFVTKDGIAAIAYFFYNMLILYLFGLMMFKTRIYSEFRTYSNISNDMIYRFIFYIPIVILQLAPVFIFIKVRKQGLRSIGLKKDKILKSIFLGIIFSMPFNIPLIISEISEKGKILGLTNLILTFVYFFIEIALVEEISFRGFIQTRIQSLIKSKWVSILVVGVMFALMHIPFQIIKANMPLGDFIVKDSFHLVFTFVIHVYLVYIYTRDNNIISSSITHTLIDFIPSIFI